MIEPGKEAAVRFSMTVPAAIEPGGYRTGVLFEFGPATGDPVGRGREVMFKSRIATLIYVSIGQPPMAAELTDLPISDAPGQQLADRRDGQEHQPALRAHAKGAWPFWTRAGRPFVKCRCPTCRFSPRANAR